MSSSSVVSLSSFNLLFFTQVLTVLTSSIKYNEYITDKGKNISIPCISDGNIMWVKENGNTIIQTGKFLVLTNISAEEQGVYVCFGHVPAKNITQILFANEHTNITARETDNFDYMNATYLPKKSVPQSIVTTEHVEEQEFEAVQKTFVIVRTPPGPVTQLYFKASTILGFLIWRFNKTNSGGYPVKSFTAEYRNISYATPSYSGHNHTHHNHHIREHEWNRMDPVNIAPNVRQMEVYHLAPNTTYEFRIWANNQLGSGEIVTTNVTTLPETKEEDLIRLLQPDLDNFDPRVWIIAVSIVLGTLVILGTGLCIVLTKECYQSTETEQEDGWDSIELIPNIILNPGFCESDENEAAYTRTIIFREDDESPDYDDYSEEEYSSDNEPRMERFKRKVSVFFTGPTIKRI